MPDLAVDEALAPADAAERPAADPAIPAPRGLVGIVRGVDAAAWRHSYGLGRRPNGVVAGEVGALRSESHPELLPLFRTEDGRFVTRRRKATLERSPGPLRIARWVVAPVAWRRVVPLRNRLAVAARRGRHVLRRPWRQAREPGEAARRPVGYLYRQRRPGTRPLVSALHPVTGDQLLTTMRREAATFGYGEPELLGHLVAAAPVTGVLVPRARQVPWASRLGLRGVRRPALRGAIQQPKPSAPLERDAFRLAGWAILAGGEDVARVEVFANGRLLGRARLGMPPPARRDLPDVPEAQLAGFLYLFGPGDLPDGDRLDVEAMVTGTKGTQYVVGTRAPLRLVEPQRPDDGGGERVAVLQARSAEFLRSLPARRDQGLNLLVFTHKLDHGGAQRYLSEQLCRLALDEDFSCTVVATADGPWRDPLERVGIEVHVSTPVRGSAEEYEGKLAELAAWASRKGFNAVFANTLDAFIGVDLASRAGLPAAWTVHESYELAVWWSLAQWNDPQPYARERCVQALGRAAAILFPADATRALYEPYAASERLVTTPLGLEFEAIDGFRRDCDRAALRGELGLPADATIVLCLGIVEPRKAQALLARAYAHVREAHPATHLVLVGEIDTPYGRGVRRYVESTLDGRATLVPATPEPYPWHAVADLFVLPSDVESSPIVLLEAMAFETPVLATNVFGVPELISDGVNGYLYEPNDVSSLAEALDRVLGTEPARLREIGEAGARRVRDRHDPDRYAANLNRLLRQLLDDRDALPAWSTDSASDG